MIPVRVPADAQVHEVGGVRRLDVDHPMYLHRCPVCDLPYGGEEITLVYVGVEADDRKPAGFMTGAAVAVHVACSHSGGGS